MHGARVLVVDDEAPLRELVRPYLEAEGLAVVEAGSGTEALEILFDGGIDVAVVDVMLPGMDGFELVRAVRRSSEVPIILLTARREEGNRIAGLKLGADDYVVKPFSAPELVARVLARLRRPPGQHMPEGFMAGRTEVLRLGEIEVDSASRRCQVAGVEIDLTRREFDLLWTLAESPGRVRTREQLLEAGWGTTYLTERTVDVHLASLRRKLAGRLRVTALRGIGYRLELPERQC
ncbi:MAG: response regulator transcription factor [Acidimicrobiales bacterium]